jgi:radical SAM superfamily enzyme YgiQ (UPF0313 family)
MQDREQGITMAAPILLIDTPYTIASRKDPIRISVPRAALFLATSLGRAGVGSAIYDPKKSALLQPWNELWYVGDSLDTIEMTAGRHAPRMVGITNQLSKDADVAAEIARRVKRACPDAWCIVGGFHATADPDFFLRDAAVDIAAIGEGETTIVELARCNAEHGRLENVRGIAFRNEHGDIVRTQPVQRAADMHAIGFPDYSRIDLEAYFLCAARGLGPRPLSIGKRTLSLITSRGCPSQCFFCNAQSIFGHRFRAYPAGDVLDHLRDMRERYHIDSVEFEDDTLSFDKERFSAIVEGLCALTPRLSWSTPNGVRADTLLDRTLLVRMKESGCRYLTIGVESGCQEFLNGTVKKRLDLTMVRALARMCAELRLPLNAFFIIGFPDESLQQIGQTLDFAMMLNRTWGVFPFVNYAIPIPGTAMYEICRKKGYLTHNVTPARLACSASSRGQGLISTPEFTPDRIAALMAEFNTKIFRARLAQLAKHPVTALRTARLALRTWPHLLRYILG